MASREIILRSLDCGRKGRIRDNFIPGLSYAGIKSQELSGLPLKGVIIIQEAGGQVEILTFYNDPKYGRIAADEAVGLLQLTFKFCRCSLICGTV
jgi:hypothetical protein